MDTVEKYRRLVRCSACGGSIGDRVNLVVLNRKATWKHPTAGNVLTGESGQAVAVCCDQCCDARRPPVEAVELNGDTVTYHPVESLEEIPRDDAAEAEQGLEDDDVFECWCGARGTYEELFDDSTLEETCGGLGTLHCHCGGDLCICHHHGSTECPGCEQCEIDDGFESDFSDPDDIEED